MCISLYMFHGSEVVFMQYWCIWWFFIVDVGRTLIILCVKCEPFNTSQCLKYFYLGSGANVGVLWSWVHQEKEKALEGEKCLNFFLCWSISTSDTFITSKTKAKWCISEDYRHQMSRLLWHSHHLPTTTRRIFFFLCQTCRRSTEESCSEANSALKSHRKEY